MFSVGNIKSVHRSDDLGLERLTFMLDFYIYDVLVHDPYPGGGHPLPYSMKLNVTFKKNNEKFKTSKVKR